MIGNDDYLLDSASVNSGKFVFKKQLFYTGVYRLAFNNSNNSLDFVINPSELKNNKSIHIQLNAFRIKKNYIISNSLENKIKKLYTAKEESISSKIKLIKKVKNQETKSSRR